MQLLTLAPLLHQEKADALLTPVSGEAGLSANLKVLDPIGHSLDDLLLGQLEALLKLLHPGEASGPGVGLQQVSEGLHHTGHREAVTHLVDHAKIALFRGPKNSLNLKKRCSVWKPVWSPNSLNFVATVSIVETAKIRVKIHANSTI